MVFISFSLQEASIAEVFKHWIEASFEHDVFLCNDPEGIPAGEEWEEALREHLNACSVVLVLCSKEAGSRPWINFEVGCGWLRGIPVIPICHSKQVQAGLPTTIQMFQPLCMDDDHFIRNLLSSLAQHLGSRLPKIDEPKMHQELEKAYEEYRVKQRRVEVRVERAPQGWPTAVTFSFLPGAGMDLIDDIARIANLDPGKFGIDWALRHEDGRSVPRDGRLLTFRALMGAKHLLVLTIGPNHVTPVSSQQPKSTLQPASRAQRKSKSPKAPRATRG